MGSLNCIVHESGCAESKLRKCNHRVSFPSDAGRYHSNQGAALQWSRVTPDYAKVTSGSGFCWRRARMISASDP